MIRALNACLSLLGFWMVVASDASAAETIYRVEMIVFERTASTSNEAWPKNLTLEYPARKQKLSSRETVLRQGTPEAIPGAPIAGTEQPGTEFFTFLPPDRRSLQKTRDALDRNRQLRVVFHEAWRQPMTTIEKSPALLLHGGNQYGSRHELQGYIQLGVSRFLHLHTNLWFTHFMRNHGQISEHWPNLPEEPEGLLGAPAPEEDFNSAGQQDWPPSESEEGSSEDSYEASAQAPYIISQIVALQQKRRLRSGELHYLDHPRIGVLVKIVPDDKAAPEA